MQVVKKSLAGATLVAIVGLFVASIAPQPVRAKDKDDKKGDVDHVKVVNGPSEPVPVTGQISVTLPAVQNVSGTVNVGNLPAVQNVGGTVNVGNLPAVQTIQGNVIAPLAPFGVFNSMAVMPGPSAPAQFVVTPNHDMQLWVNVASSAPAGQAVVGEVFNATLTQFFYIPTTFLRNDITSGLDFRFGSSSFPMYVPANSHLTLALTRDVQATGFFQGSITLTGILLN